MTNRLQHLPKYEGVTLAGQWTGQVLLHPNELQQPLSWRKPSYIFVCSMSDLFHSAVPFDFICQIFHTMSLAEWHTFQVLTKRPGRMAYFAEKVWPHYRPQWFWQEGSGRGIHPSHGMWPKNIWAGTSVESQKYAPRLDVLARVPARERFVSAEPLLGPLDLRRWLAPSIRIRRAEEWIVDRSGVSWVIVGGESGPGARPVHPQWVRDIRDQCQRAGVPFFFKQWGAWKPWLDDQDGDPEYLRHAGNWGQMHPNGKMVKPAGERTAYNYWMDGYNEMMIRVSKKNAGALLDGREYQEMPQ